MNPVCIMKHHIFVLTRKRNKRIAYSLFIFAVLFTMENFNKEMQAMMQ